MHCEFGFMLILMLDPQAACVCIFCAKTARDDRHKLVINYSASLLQLTMCFCFANSRQRRVAQGRSV